MPNQTVLEKPLTRKTIRATMKGCVGGWVGRWVGVDGVRSGGWIGGCGCVRGDTLKEASRVSKNASEARSRRSNINSRNRL